MVFQILVIHITNTTLLDHVPQRKCLGSKNQHNNYHNDFLSKKNPKHTHEQKPSANFFELEHKIFDEF